MTAPTPTPVRGALTDESTLRPLVKDGLGAVQNAHKAYFVEEVRAEFADSIDIDEALREGRERDNRWDYLLGHSASGTVVAVEPHSARDDEVSTVIAKRTAARDQLKDHLRPGAAVARWLWVASGKVCFANTEKTRLRLDQSGIEFVGKQVQAKHLPAAGGTSSKGKSGSGAGRAGKRKKS
jgi:hypothetical protein